MPFCRGYDGLFYAFVTDFSDKLIFQFVWKFARRLATLSLFLG